MFHGREIPWRSHRHWFMAALAVFAGLVPVTPAQAFVVWFDGRCIIDIGDLPKQYCPKSMIFQGPQARIRWPGTESGRLPYPAWDSLKIQDIRSGVATAAHGDSGGNAWTPFEADRTLYDHNWFWAAENERKRKSLNQLMEIYYESVGRGGVLLEKDVPLTGAKLVLSMGKDESVSIVPSGARLSGRAIK